MVDFFMDDYTSNITFDQAVDLLRNADRVSLTTHAKPDGDAFGSVVALAGALKSLGKQVNAFVAGPILPSLERLSGLDELRIDDDDPTFGDPQLLLVLDTGAVPQLTPMMPQIRPHLDRTLIIDHHVSGNLESKWRYVDASAAACAEIVAEFVDALGVGLDEPRIRDGLFVGIASDTGWFRFSNTRPATHDLAARLLRAGADHASLYAAIQQSERAEKLALMTKALDSLQLLADQSVALMVLRAADFQDTDTSTADSDFLVDLPQIVASVQVVVLVSEPQPVDGRAQPIRISFRSKPGPDAVDVSAMAQLFGGGGHQRAAGAKVSDSLDHVVAKMIKTLTANPLNTQP